MSVSQYFSSDQQFLSLFSEKNKKANRIHYTPLAVAKKAAEFLCGGLGNKILDIGSCIGKFCFTAAHYYPAYTFYGIEQRGDLIEASEKTNETLQLSNVFFEHKNFDQITLTDYHHFYFFNSFHENIEEDKLDYQVAFSENLYHYYNAQIHKQLSKMPTGTRIATFFTLDDIIPASYLLIDTHFDEGLKFYEKI
jgi:SAM-dependent methyltransferase